MVESTPTNILWLSDIHFRTEYFKEPKKFENSLKPFLHSFLEYIKTEFGIQSSQPESANDNSDDVSLGRRQIDYVIITGDLAFSGLKSEYSALDKSIISPLKTILGERTKFLAIPGNHDVEWVKVDLVISKIFAAGGTLHSAFKDKNTLLSTHRPDFINLFSSFSEYLKTFNLNSGISSAGTGQADHRLFGHYIDEDKKIFFLLLNSAWFSVSNSIQSEGLDKFINVVLKNRGTKKSDLLTQANDLLKLSQYANETRSQVVGQTLALSDELLKVMDGEKYHSYSKITLIHHPFHWLSPKELYSYSPIKPLLHEIFSRSDLILTGHEHMPIEIGANQIYSRPWHLQAGMFIPDKIKDHSSQDVFQHNRFSVISIFTDNAFEEKHLYDATDNCWKPQKKFAQQMAFKRKYRAVSETRDDYINLFMSKDRNQIASYFLAHYDIRLNGSSGDYHLTDQTLMVQGYTDQNSGHIWIIIRPIQAGYYQKKLVALERGKHHLDTHIDSIFEKYNIKDDPDKRVNIVFFSLDLLVNDKLYHPVEGQQKSSQHSIQQKKNFGKIILEADYYFDKFCRHIYFKRNLSYEKFQRQSKINFINIVFPYWRI